MGIKNGLAGLDDGPDWRGPVADRIYIPTADGGRTVTDALTVTHEVAGIGRALAGQTATEPKEGIRYHFGLPGAVQGFLPEESIECAGTTWVKNVALPGGAGERALAIHYHGLADGRVSRVVRETLPDYCPSAGYQVVASPTIYSGQLLEGRLLADADNETQVRARLFVKVCCEDDELTIVYGPDAALGPGGEASVAWTVRVPDGRPIAWLGVELGSAKHADGTVYLDWLTWSGPPDVSLGPPRQGGTRWLEAWVRACDVAAAGRDHDLRLIQNVGTGLLIQGAREWQDYTTSGLFTPHLAESFGIAARVQGLKRYYALRLTRNGEAQLVRELDGTHVLAQVSYDWELYRSYRLGLTVEGQRIIGRIDGENVFDIVDESPLTCGAMALLIEEGRVGCDDVMVGPA